MQAEILACGILSGALSTDEMPFPGQGNRHSGVH